MRSQFRRPLFRFTFAALLIVLGGFALILAPALSPAQAQDQDNAPPAAPQDDPEQADPDPDADEPVTGSHKVFARLLADLRTAIESEDAEAIQRLGLHVRGTPEEIRAQVRGIKRAVDLTMGAWAFRSLDVLPQFSDLPADVDSIKFRISTIGGAAVDGELEFEFERKFVDWTMDDFALDFDGAAYKWFDDVLRSFVRAPQFALSEEQEELVARICRPEILAPTDTTDFGAIVHGFLDAVFAGDWPTTDALTTAKFRKPAFDTLHQLHGEYADGGLIAFARRFPRMMKNIPPHTGEFRVRLRAGSYDDGWRLQVKFENEYGQWLIESFALTTPEAEIDLVSVE